MSIMVTPTMDHSSRRRFLSFTAVLGGALTACSKPEDAAQSTDAPSRLGKPVSGYGDRSSYEKSKRGTRESKTPEASSSRTPLEDLYGSITPSALHFERHHSGVPDIDPDKHELFIHGLVERPLALSVADLKRMPSVSRVYFVECSGNSGGEWGAKRGPTASVSHGLASNSEWTGVPLKVVLQEVGLKPEATWLLAEGGDACRMSRSVPVAKALDDALLAYGQNGEALRPGQGYPLRLILPGWEGNTNVKWLRRIQAGDQPFMTKDETSKYTDLLADGTARMFTYEMDAKSVVTRPSGGQKLAGLGFYEISGVAWSGRGRIEKVEVSTDGGATWMMAELDEPRHAKAFTRFRTPWRWEGGETKILSRATDETGYVQPSVEELIAARGQSSLYHNNGIKIWQVGADGAVGAPDA